MCVCVYVPDNLENSWKNVMNFYLKKSRICPIWGQSDSLWVQIWSPWFGKVQMKQQSDLDDARNHHRLLNIF